MIRTIEQGIECRNHSTPPGGLLASRALHEMPMVVAAMHLVMAVAEHAHVVRLTEGTLAPPWMDGPRTASPRTSTASPRTTSRSTVPTTPTRVHCGSALFEAPGRPAASDLCGLITEGADVMRLTERPAPSVEHSSLQSCLVVPPFLGRHWVRILLRAGHLQEGAYTVESSRIIGEGVCELCTWRHGLLCDVDG